MTSDGRGTTRAGLPGGRGLLQIDTRRNAYPLILPAGAQRGAELGVMQGENARDLLDARRAKTLWLVDDWSNPHASRKAVENLIADRPEAEIVTADADAWLRSLQAGSLDWAYLDTTHWRENTERELDAMIHAVRPGGIVACHDFCVFHLWGGGVVLPVLEAITAGRLRPIAITNEVFPSIFCERV